MAGKKFSFGHLLGRKAKATEDEDEKARKAKSRQAEEDERDEDAQSDEDREDAEEQDDEKQGRKVKKAKTVEDDDPDADDDEGDDQDAEDDEDNKEVKKGRRAERTRCSRIFSSQYAAGRPDMAAHLAFNTKLSSAEAINTLKMMDAVQPTTARVTLDSRMRAERQVRIALDANQLVSNSANAIASRMKNLYNSTKGKK
ncbi:hypothetical protein [Arsenophonus nasoniae]|uniref:Uncharacterized protein n=1 Tax=Arsenophonus nasoniae TaxID=638 RepID=A0AA95GH80_9GAMM|nr:hypothetical protein [Arsenophonus nasoniae]WGL96293.1 hypothetical protein QE207_06925 [Arsenophonus nasoniae]